MAYSPTPQNTGLPNAGHKSNSNPFYRLERHSPSPPTQQTALSKRDRRRIALQERLAEISSNFAENRDANYRKQLQQYQADINFINTAQLYDNKPLLEPGEEDDDKIVVNGASTVRQQPPNPINGNARHEIQPKTGRHAAGFVNEVNDALERRDVDLTGSAYNFNFSIQQYEKDYRFAVEVAEKEHQRLLKSLRQQLISNVQQKKATLHREKEKLDIADTNALLHYPNQFSINNTASPGGPQSNRKTRHTRHRLDADDLDTAINNSTANGKRKRKTAGETDGAGSPGPTQSRELEITTINGFKETQPRLEVQTAPPPAYTLNRLFTDRELNANLQEATYEVIRSHTFISTTNNGNTTKRRKPNLTDVPLPTTADHTTADLDDTASTTFAPEPTTLDAVPAPETLAAAAMDRTPSQLYHATRSTNRLHPLPTTDTRTTLGELAGRHSAADLIGSYSRANEKPKKADNGDDYQRAPPVSEQEGAEDVKLMEAAMRRVDNAVVGYDGEEGDGDGDEEGGDPGEDAGLDRKVLELALGEEKEDFVGPVGFGDEMVER